MREIIDFFWNNQFVFVGTAIFLAGLTVAVVGYIDLKLRKKVTKKTA